MSAVVAAPISQPRSSLRTGPRAFLSAFFRRGQAQLGGVIVLILLVMALFAPLIAPYDPNEIQVGEPLTGPSRAHIFGTDDLGRDMFSRIVYGSRITLRIGTIAVALAAGIGVLVGLIAGYYGGWVDTLLMRFTDVMLAFPGILLALAIVAVLGPGLNHAMVAVGLGSWPAYARLVRGAALSVREMDYVTAERLLGARSSHVMRRVILPNVLAPIIVLASLEFPAAVLSAAALSFLGLGAQPPTPEWGALLVDARNYIQTAPWLINFPGAAIFFVVLSFNLLGNTLRDVLDPRVRNR